MSPPTMNPTAHMSQYSALPADVVDRHDFGVQKNRKPASTGGGRAWSEDEEVYLLQTRLQKMPYKHIAAHLKKTELACRLHYHQLSHGSNRRKRTTSVSSGSSVRSPIMNSATIPSPIHEADLISNPPTPPFATYSPVSDASHITLPSAATLLTATTQRAPIAILPKPSPPRRSLSDNIATPLRLNCSVSVSSAQTLSSIDRERLRSIYNSHRAAFWLGIAAEYGEGVNPLLLEEAWLRGSVNAPPTPCISPDSNSCYGMGRGEYKDGVAKATSISALLGIDASPRSPKEREMIKRLEEEGRDVRMEMV